MAGVMRFIGTGGSFAEKMTPPHRALPVALLSVALLPVLQPVLQPDLKGNQ